MQRARYQDILGETINRRLEEYLNSPAYNYAEDEVVQKIASIKKVKADAAEEAKIVMLEELVTGVPVDQAQSTAPSTPSPTTLLACVNPQNQHACILTNSVSTNSMEKIRHPI